MKHIKKFNEGTVQDWRDDMTYLTKEMHEHQCKEFYLFGDGMIQKYIIPPQYRGDFEAEYMDGENIKDSAEFVHYYARMNGSVMILMDYEIQKFAHELEDVMKSDGYDLSEDFED